MVVYSAYCFHLVDVFFNAVCLFLLFQVYLRLKYAGRPNRVCYFQLWNGRSGSGGCRGMAFYGCGCLDVVSAEYSRNGKSGQDVRFIVSRGDDLIVYRNGSFVYAVLAYLQSESLIN